MAAEGATARLRAGGLLVTCIDRLADELEVEPEDGLEIEVEHAG